MFNNIGGKIKGLAKVLFWATCVISVIMGLVMIATEHLIIGLPLLIAGPVGAWISSWFLYGFGEIISTLKAIEENTREKKEVKPTYKAPAAKPTKNQKQKNAVQKTVNSLEEEPEEQPEDDGEGDEEFVAPQVRCPKCHREHDFDYPKCPHCDHDY